MFKDRVVKPLIVATEKVVEYYMPDQDNESLSISQNMENKEE